MKNHPMLSMVIVLMISSLTLQSVFDRKHAQATPGKAQEGNPACFVHGCKSCKKSPNTCDYCAHGFYQVANECNRCMEGCHFCSSGNNCAQCKEGYSINSSGICRKGSGEGFFGSWTNILYTIAVVIFILLDCIFCDGELMRSRRRHRRRNRSRHSW